MFYLLKEDARAKNQTTCKRAKNVNNTHLPSSLSCVCSQFCGRLMKYSQPFVHTISRLLQCQQPPWCCPPRNHPCNAKVNNYVQYCYWSFNLFYIFIIFHLIFCFHITQVRRKCLLNHFFVKRLTSVNNFNVVFYTGRNYAIV